MSAKKNSGLGPYEMLAACEAEGRQLEEQAGIAESAAKAYGAHTPLHLGSDAPHGSERACREDKEYWEDQHDTMVHLLREAYFSVPDVSMRKRLIAKSRRTEELRIEFFRQKKRDALVASQHAPVPNPIWWINAAVWTVLIVAIGHDLLGTTGAIAGGVSSLFLGRYLEEVEKLRRGVRIRHAEHDLKIATAEENEIVNMAQIFSLEEAETGDAAELR
jgi:hypothetical protein